MAADPLFFEGLDDFAFPLTVAPSTTDYHTAIRDAIVTTLTPILAGYANLTVKALEDVDSDIKTIDLPAVTVICIGPEQDRAELTTNAQDGLGYACLVSLLSHGVTAGEKSPGVPSMTLFRRIVHTAFHDKRLTGITQVCWCEVSAAGPIYDKDSPAFQKLQSAVVVTAIGRFPRS